MLQSALALAKKSVGNLPLLLHKFLAFLETIALTLDIDDGILCILEPFLKKRFDLLTAAQKQQVIFIVGITTTIDINPSSEFVLCNYPDNVTFPFFLVS